MSHFKSKHTLNQKPFGICDLKLTIWSQLRQMRFSFFVSALMDAPADGASKASRDGLQVKPPTSAFQSKVSSTTKSEKRFQNAVTPSSIGILTQIKVVFQYWLINHSPCSEGVNVRRQINVQRCSTFTLKGRNIISCSFLAVTQWGRRGPPHFTAHPVTKIPTIISSGCYFGSIITHK